MTKTQVRKFNAQGNDAFSTIVREKAPDILDRVDALLADPSMTEAVTDAKGANVDVEIKYHARRFELAEQLWCLFGHGMPLAQLSGDTAVWNWLSASWMRPLVNGSGLPMAKVLGKEEERWILTSTVLRYHRHLISGPFFSYEANHENPKQAMCMLATPVVSPGEVVERIAGKRSLSIGSVCHLATLIYFDPVTKELRNGHTSSPGNPKAFSYYFSQLDVNVDYLGMDVDSLLDLLPSNFERWVKLAKEERKKGLS
jgi:hypothetical protein